MGLLGIIGSADVVSGNDATVSLRVLNRMIDGWTQHPFLATHSAFISFALPANTQTRTIGPSGQVVSERPIKIEIGAYTSMGGIDQPLTVIERDVYAGIDLKTSQGSWPSVVYYEPASPAGALYFWPLAGASVTVNLPVRVQVSQFADLTTEYTLPDGYEAAIVPSLAEKLAPYFERAVPAEVVRSANAARQVLKRANAKVPQMDICGRPYQSRMGAFLGG